jgi:hypothetical protein
VEIDNECMGGEGAKNIHEPKSLFFCLERRYRGVQATACNAGETCNLKQTTPCERESPALCFGSEFGSSFRNVPLALGDQDVVAHYICHSMGRKAIPATPGSQNPLWFRLKRSFSFLPRTARIVMFRGSRRAESSS